MLEFENKFYYEQQFDKSNEKNKYLSLIRSLAINGQYFSLINLIDETIPNVS